MNERFDNRLIFQSLKRIDTGENAGNGVRKLIVRDLLSAVFDKILTYAICDKCDPAATRSSSRFDDKLFAIFDCPLESGDVAVMADDVKELGCGYPVLGGQALCKEFVVHKGKGRPRVVGHDILGVTPVHAENSRITEPSNSTGAHDDLLKVLKRRYSDRR
jgi:hypothetical protein